jgi:hypothetical protein
MELVVVGPQGLYWPPGDFYIDPWRPVHRAVVTHAHADMHGRGARNILWRPAEQQCRAAGWVMLWKSNAEEGRASVLFGYAFGKAQRLLAGVNPEMDNVLHAT